MCWSLPILAEHAHARVGRAQVNADGGSHLVCEFSVLRTTCCCGVVVRESKTENLSEIPYVVGSTQNGMKFLVLLQEEKLVGELKFGKWKEGQLCLPNLSAALILGVAFHGLP